MSGLSAEDPADHGVPHQGLLGADDLPAAADVEALGLAGVGPQLVVTEGDGSGLGGLEQLPAFVHLAQDGTLVGVAEGWQAAEWSEVAQGLTRVLKWSNPVIPAHGDPGPFEGSPALGAPADA